MTRERARELAPIIKAYGKGAEVEFYFTERNKWYPTVGSPGWEDGVTYRIKPAPRLRPMTRGEVLYMVTTCPWMVVRDPSGIKGPAAGCLYHGDMADYEYAIIDRRGNPIDGWHKFEIEDDDGDTTEKWKRENL